MKVGGLVALAAAAALFGCSKSDDGSEVADHMLSLRRRGQI